MINDFRFHGAKPGRKLFIIISLMIMIVYVILILYPLYNMVISSFRSTRDIIGAPFSFPKSIDFKNYRIVWIEKHFNRYFMNSLLVTVCAMTFVLILGSMAAFGISRYTYKLNTMVYMLFLSGIMLPLKASIIPLFMIVKRLGLMDKPLAIILIFIATGIPSTVFILSGFMKGIPADLENAARIDGCNDLGIFTRVILPICTPSIALVTIYNSVPIWNDFFFPLVFIQSDAYKTLPVGLSTFIGQHDTNWSMMFTGLAISIVPMIMMYLFMSKYFIKGMTAGAVK